ncbi:PQ-loop repeat - like 5, partial [Theobroma cacao]
NLQNTILAFSQDNGNYVPKSARDERSFTLGLINIISWSVAKIPQIITNYKEKSVEGLSLSFLITWIVGWAFLLFYHRLFLLVYYLPKGFYHHSICKYLFNVFGCILEPTTIDGGNDYNGNEKGNKRLEAGPDTPFCKNHNLLLLRHILRSLSLFIYESAPHLSVSSFRSQFPGIGGNQFSQFIVLPWIRTSGSTNIR